MLISPAGPPIFDSRLSPVQPHTAGYGTVTLRNNERILHLGLITSAFKEHLWTSLEVIREGQINLLKHHAALSLNKHLHFH